MLLAIAAVASTMAGFGITFACEKKDQNRTFRSGEQIEIETGTQTLALVPLTHSPAGPQDEVFDSAASFYGEAIRGLYMALLLRQKFKMLVVTSAHPGEGKTTLAISLAIIAARAGRKILLVDADLCKSRATQVFGLTGNHGFAELILGHRPFSEVVAKAGSSSSNFHLIGAGERSSAMAARSALESAAVLFRHLREEYDLIIIDTPPVLAVSDAVALSTQADATLFAVRWGATPRVAAKLGLKRLLGSSGTGNIGFVLTMVDPRKHSRYDFADSAFYTKELLGYHRIT
jgi:capsular exopolysaccharide synthesis family protein